jgi:hypothetical protein
LALTDDGHVFVADRFTNCVVVLNSSLELSRILLSSDQPLDDPVQLCYRQQGRQLFVLTNGAVNIYRLRDWYSLTKQSQVTLVKRRIFMADVLCEQNSSSDSSGFGQVDSNQFSHIASDNEKAFGPLEVVSHIGDYLAEKIQAWFLKRNHKKTTSTSKSGNRINDATVAEDDLMGQQLLLSNREQYRPDSSNYVVY